MRKRSRIKLLIFILIILSIFSLKKFLKREKKNLIKSNIILYRILGNDLPPRHSFNQTIINLLFILQNELLFINVTKIWILNRIVNNSIEQKLINLLNQYKQIYFRIPFNSNEYRHISYYFPLDYPSDDYFKSKKFHQLSSLEKLRLIDTLYHYKNLYVMNNNGARNFALKHGKQQTQAKWLMIFDSNCFLSQKGFDEIQQSLLINGSRIQYFIVPMYRLIDNNEIFHINRTKPKDEPQIIFRRDSTIEFLETMRYGYRSKEELLTYLGVRKYKWKSFPWDSKQRKSIDLFGNKTNSLFQYTSFIFRLYSGLHPINEQSTFARTCNRHKAVIIFLEKLDFKIKHDYLLSKPLNINLNQCTLWSDEQIKTNIEIARKITNRKS